jgi:exonuclease SbcC
MQILSVALQNFKTHHDKYVEFQPGINAISGENGAGKTSLLEAIAWVLFNYQGDYAKEDLIRNGNGSAQVTVRFTSNYDSRTYEVQRCTQRGYILFDPQLNERLPYSRIKDEVLPWLKQHIGVPASTNLPQLFARTVGVPQGTFTADFLMSAEQRKAVFDAILKVEDYKLAYKQMNSLRRYAEDQVDAVKGQIAQYEDSLIQWDELRQRQQTLQQDIQAQQQQLTQLQQTLTGLATQRQVYRLQQQQLQTLTEQRQGLTTQISHQNQLITRLEPLVQQAAEAIRRCAANQSAYEGYQKSEQDLQTLNQQQQRRQTLQEQYRGLQTARQKHQNQLAQLRAQLDGLVKTEQDLAALQPQVEQQQQLEVQQQQVKDQLKQLQLLELKGQNLDQQLQDLQQQATSLEQSCQRLGGLQAAVGEITALEEQRDRIQQQSSRIHAARQFQAELEELVRRSKTQQQHQSPTLTATLAAIQAALGNGNGVEAAAELMARLEAAVAANSHLTTDLLIGLEGILQDLADQTNAAALTRQLKSIQQDLTERYRWQGEMAQLPALQAQRQTNQQNQQQVQAQLEQIQQQLTAQTTLQATQENLQQQIKDLGYPREKSQILERTLTGKGQLEKTYTSLLQAQTEQDQELVGLTTELDSFQGLDLALAQLQAQRQDYQLGYDLYLQHQHLAAQHPQLQQELATAQAELQQLQAQLKTTEADHKTALETFDPETAEALECEYQTVKSESDQLSGRLPEKHQRLADINQQLQGLEAIAQKRDAAQQQLKTKEKVKRFINFARRVYKEAGPRITEQYVRVIAYQADKLFRDLIGRPNVALSWTRDYEIVVQEGANQRRFVNLSGGEQMCAALAVRLALLKVLADIDVAFFDEPTTNMDRVRRESLAEAIGRIKSFQQLFVISHDDTFEKVTENIIFLEREPGL